MARKRPTGRWESHRFSSSFEVAPSQTLRRAASSTLRALFTGQMRVARRLIGRRLVSVIRSPGGFDSRNTGTHAMPLRVSNFGFYPRRLLIVLLANGVFTLAGLAQPPRPVVKV